MDIENDYDKIKKFYVDKLNFSEELVEYLANEELILTCVEGRSNSYLSNKYNASVENIVEMLQKYLGFNGWERDLDFNPFDIFEVSCRLLDDYGFNLTLISPTITDEQIVSTFFICKVFTELRERMNNEYYKT